MKLLKKLWRRLFPVRDVFVPQYRDPDLVINSDYKDFLPELVHVQGQAPAMFAWLYIRLRELEVQFHTLPNNPTKEDLFAFAVDHYAIGKEIEQIKDAIKVPATASRLMARKEQEKKDIKEGKYTNWGEN